jgi:uncharacterized protein (DUF302 family)
MHSLQTTVDGTMEAVEDAVRAALAAEGFGVVSEIDLAARLQVALGVDRPPLKILGACSPRFAHQALEIDPSIALLLPCNVVVQPDGERTSVSVVDPRALITDPRFTELAVDAADRLTAALAALGGAVSETVA